MPTLSTSQSRHLATMLCVLVILIVLLATLYAGWIGISNFSRIGV